MGLNNIFGQRKDEPVRLDKLVAERLGKKFLKPDSIFGLRQTRNIENLLYDTRNSALEADSPNKEKQLHELLAPSPVSRKGDILLYPFLVLEAKSGKSDSDWQAIRMQTAFPIKKFLDTQNRLREAAAEHSEWRAGPLVWFIANRGEDWRLSAAYIEQDETKKSNVARSHYVSMAHNKCLHFAEIQFNFQKVVDLWRGSICTPDGALQILLLVDYIFDWARDVYRDDIIRELRLLASGDNDLASVYSDTDIYSTREQGGSSFQEQGDTEQYQSYITLQSTYTDLDSGKGLFRHATFVQSRYCALVLTADNVQTVLQSIPQNKKEKLCNLILDHMQWAVVLDVQALKDIEQQWTGTSRSSPSRFSPTRFYSVISCTSYLSGNWHQVRELYVVAIAEDAWDAIVEASKLKKGRGKTRKPCSMYCQANVTSLLKIVNRLQAGTPADVLHASIVRRAVKIRIDIPGPRTSDTDSAPINSVNDGSSDVIPGENDFHNGVLCYAMPDEGKFRDLMHYIYKSFKWGILEPNLPFLDFSQRFDLQHLREDDLDPIYFRGAPLQVSDSGCVLIHSGCHSQGPERSKSDICMYLVGGTPTAPSQKQQFDWLLNTIETRDAYHTTRNNGTSNLINHNQKIYKIPWNLEEPYGIDTVPFKFLNLLKDIGANIQDKRMPSTQGSLRKSAKSGSYLHTRNIVPWQDQRLLIRGVGERMFIAYKVMTSEIEFWRVKAEKRRKKGTPCCKICAQKGFYGTTLGYGCCDSGICMECFRNISTSGENWVANAIAGKPTFPDFDPHRESLESRWFFEMYTDCWDRWRESLAPYPKLHDNFQDLPELHAQMLAFREWEKQQWQARRERWRALNTRELFDTYVEDEEQNEIDSGLSS